jgi:hypothetical protein
MKKLFLIALGLVSFNVNADPTYDATRGALQNNSALCGYGYNPNCSSGSRSTPPPKKIIYHDVKVPSKFGAIAINEKAGAVAASSNMSSIAEAKREAIRLCESDGRYAPCRDNGWVRNGCIAAASGKKSSKFQLFNGIGERGEAERLAINLCNKAKASECQIIVPETCSLP